jgi:hypothetical protein
VLCLLSGAKKDRNVIKKNNELPTAVKLINDELVKTKSEVTNGYRILLPSLLTHSKTPQVGHPFMLNTFLWNRLRHTFTCPQSSLSWTSLLS